MHRRGNAIDRVPFIDIPCLASRQSAPNQRHIATSRTFVATRFIASALAPISFGIVSLHQDKRKAPIFVFPLICPNFRTDPIDHVPFIDALPKIAPVCQPLGRSQLWSHISARTTDYIGAAEVFLAIPNDNATGVARSSPIHRGSAQSLGKEGRYEEHNNLSHK